MTSHLDDLPKLHEREQRVRAAASELRSNVFELGKELTTGEYLRILADVFGGEIASIAKYAIREERHGDQGIPGGLEGPKNTTVSEDWLHTHTADTYKEGFIAGLRKPVPPPSIAIPECYRTSKALERVEEKLHEPL